MTSDMSTSTAATVRLQPRRWLGLRSYALRWVFALGVGLLAFHEPLLRTLENVRQGAGAYSVTAILMAVILLIGIDRRRQRELPIHDREVDYIAGGLALIVAVTVQWQLVPRFADWYYLLRLDLLALIVWCFGTAALLFGLRATLRFSPAWFVLLLVGAPVFQLLTLAAGGNWWGTATASTLCVSLACGMAVGGTGARRIRTAVAVLVVSLVVMTAIALLVAAPSAVTAQLPAVLAVLLVGVVGYRSGSAPPLLRRRAPTVHDTRGAMALLVVSAVALALVPLPANLPGELVPGPPSPSVPGVDVPAGWSELDRVDLPWARTYFGDDATLTHQLLRADHPVAKWDREGRPREVVVDTLRAPNSYRRRLFSDETLYTTINGRRSESLDVNLGHGVTGNVYTVLDEDSFLTSTRLNFTWTREDGIVEHISVIAVDDHRAAAPFPELTRSLGGLVLQLATILLRGNAVTVDEATRFKDLDLVSVVGRGIVEQTWREYDPTHVHPAD